MNEDDTSGAEAQEYIDAIVEQDREDAARPAKEYRPRKPQTPSLIMLALVLAGLTAWNVTRITSEPALFTPAEREADVILDVLLAVDAIEEYVEENGRLPQSLEAIDADAEGLSYQADGTTYELREAHGVEWIVHGRGDDTETLSRRLIELIGDGT